MYELSVMRVFYSLRPFLYQAGFQGVEMRIKMSRKSSDFKSIMNAFRIQIVTITQ